MTTFNETWRWVLYKSPHTGEPKTVTSRLARDTDHTWIGGSRTVNGITSMLYTEVRTEKGGLRWRVGQVVPVQPGRGKHAVYYQPKPDGGEHFWYHLNNRIDTVPSETDRHLWHRGQIHIYAIWRWDVRYVGFEEARQEGFSTPTHFLETWMKLNDDTMHGKGWKLDFRGKDAQEDFIRNEAFWLEVMQRPDRFYKAYALKFEVVPDPAYTGIVKGR